MIYAPAPPPDLAGVRTRAGDFAIDELAPVMSAGVIVSDAVDGIFPACPGAPAIAFCVDIAHREMVAAAFAARGYRAAHVDGKPPKEERRRLIAALGTGEIQVLSNCGLISEGLDVPTAAAAILLRPTKSLTLYLQQVGRALRPADGKRRSFSTMPATPSASAWPISRASGPSPAARRRRPRCRSNAAPNAARSLRSARESARNAMPCRFRRGRRFCTRAGRGHLVELGRLAVISYRQALRWAGHDEQRLRLVARSRGYKPGWVWHRLQELRGGER